MNASSPPATVREIASLAGVSPASVSRALRNPDVVSTRTRQLVSEAMTQIQESQQGASQQTIGALGCLFVNATSGPRFSGFDATIWAGLARIATGRGTNLVLLNLDHRSQPDSLGSFVEQCGVGALAVRTDDHSPRFMDALAECGVPAVVLAHKHDHPGVGYICVDSRTPSREAVHHLIHLGHRRIAFCTNFVDDYDHTERRLGYLDALAEHGIEPRQDYMLSIPADAKGGVSAIERLIALREPPTAVYFADPVPTIAALRRLHELRVRVPEDFAVVGFDDDQARLLGTPVYTSVCQNVGQLAELASHKLCQALLAREPVPLPRIELESFLEINDTTAAARDSG